MRNNKVVKRATRRLKDITLLTCTCTQTQITFFPTKFGEVVNLSGLVVHKGSNTRDNDSN